MLALVPIQIVSATSCCWCQPLKIGAATVQSNAMTCADGRRERICQQPNVLGINFYLQQHVRMISLSKLNLGLRRERAREVGLWDQRLLGLFGTREVQLLTTDPFRTNGQYRRQKPLLIESSIRGGCSVQRQ
ncbi:hypothetical protein CONLIGDRAFT_5787 [Coniochaeta ligniaria NRRL 30616]|uniref:Secreted protein n=1 Tax=Coniochaeta ligniaria NRRL 30616 TaxID=1408157 RepID=A0A1J7JM20_9PEZI|nr:hypothetical protein CONLIGDRAFT_5787 [Coniochaeta ligniaria NRRL 30616]